ncbi:hypothetical protein [Flavihumibacter profundi]|uniref:hypothetical protein n=1 Tax=Flavihumibacter profundi TaxID=2716883 RepID=UPI001CC7134B|nr:hypothetical protein [Flavihumibacter profundi]MBZ5859011.1 hypothetical protein [Flavihumibacter profundi]
MVKRPAKLPSPEFGTNAFVCSVQVQDCDQNNERIQKNGGQVSVTKICHSR